MAVITSPFFDKYPKIKYDINNISTSSSGSHETVTDVFFRIGYLKNILKNSSSYYVYEIQDGDSPEVLAAKVYEDAGAAWMIIYANQIVDPLFDWPLDYGAFKNMIIDKYGSIEYAQTHIHHCEEVIKRYNSYYDETTESRFIVDITRLTSNVLKVPYRYYTPYTITTHRTSDSNVFTSDNSQIPFLSADVMYGDQASFQTTPYTADNSNESVDEDMASRTADLTDLFSINVSKTGSLAFANEVNTYEVDGKTIIETITGEAVSFYDYELRKNDAKRLIKVIKNTYYDQILNELATITKTKTPYYRTLV